MTMKMTAKQQKYTDLVKQIDAVLEGETDTTLKMVTINCILYQAFADWSWTGFYRVKNDALIVGPYQGTLGCLHIPFEKGVCGKCARTLETQVVEDVHALEQGTEHIACDPNSQSEIVIPVFNNNYDLIAVFDVDSTKKAAFDSTDKYFLEELLKNHFTEAPLS